MNMCAIFFITMVLLNSIRKEGTRAIGPAHPLQLFIFLVWNYYFRDRDTVFAHLQVSFYFSLFCCLYNFSFLSFQYLFPAPLFLRVIVIKNMLKMTIRPQPHFGNTVQTRTTCSPFNDLPMLYSIYFVYTYNWAVCSIKQQTHKNQAI